MKDGGDNKQKHPTEKLIGTDIREEDKQMCKKCARCGRAKGKGGEERWVDDRLINAACNGVGGAGSTGAWN